jgi:hypothetical protein
MIHDYYSNPNVQNRILEFLGGRDLHQATAVYITASDESSDIDYRSRPVADLPHFLNAGMDIGRSLWDRQSLIAHIDIEHVDFDQPGLAYLQPDFVYDLQRPVAAAVCRQLRGYGIEPLHLLSGRGHHFIWQISRDSLAFRQLADIGRVPKELAACYDQPRGPEGQLVEQDLGAAFSGLSMVLEYLAHCVLDQAACSCAVPVTLTAVKVGIGPQGRQSVSIDLSEYADPLYTRGTRIPFSIYLKPQQLRWLLGESVVESLPPMFSIPVHEMDDRQAVAIMRNTEAMIELAAEISTAIPYYSGATESLIAEYLDSSLKFFHDWFYEQEQTESADWPTTYDQLSLDRLPPCVRAILEHPNEPLLKPAGIQHVVRTLMAKRWHPRHIAGLIRSKYERNFGWGGKWYEYNATSRADFYTRIFAGLLATGRDRLRDFNCRSTQEKEYCPSRDCNTSLDGFASALMEPFDRAHATADFVALEPPQ